MPQSGQLNCSFRIASSITSLRNLLHLPLPVRDEAIVFCLCCDSLFVCCVRVFVSRRCVVCERCVSVVLCVVCVLACCGRVVGCGLGRGCLGVGVVLCPCPCRCTPGRAVGRVCPGCWPVPLGYQVMGALLGA